MNLKKIVSYIVGLTIMGNSIVGQNFIFADADNTMIFGQDNWNFSNSYEYFGSEGNKLYISGTYLTSLLDNVENTECSRMVDAVLSEWCGSCYGMSVTEILAKMGIIPIDYLDENATCLNEVPSLDPQNNSKAEAVINYYHLLQLTDTVQQEIANNLYNKSESEKLTDLIEKTEQVKNGGCPVLLCYLGPNWGAHAVVAYDIEYGNYIIDKTIYDGKIMILDPNTTSQEDSICMYFNSISKKWCIPGYGLKSSNGDTIILVSNDLNFINNDGYFETTTDTDTESSDSNYIAIMDTAPVNNMNISSIGKIIESDGKWINSSGDIGEIKSFYGMSGSDDESIIKFVLRDSLSGYSFDTKDTAQPLDLNMSYEESYLSVSGNKGISTKFAPKGYIEFNGEDSDYCMNMIFNEGCYSLPWYDIQASGTNINTISMDKTDEGIVIKGDNLSNVEISAKNQDILTKVTFTTEYQSALIYDIDDYTIGVKVDINNDGIFDRNIAQSKTFLNINDYSTLGDIDSDYSISMMDLLLLKKGILYDNISDNQNADINADGKINIIDLLQLQKYIFS